MNNKLKIIFLGTPEYVQPIKSELEKHFKLTDSAKDADLGVVAAYGHILTEEELDAPRLGTINVHPSLLPKYRGASPIQQAILNGDTISGITIIKIDQEVDHGPIIYQENFEFMEDDTFESLSKKMFARAAQILPQIIEDFANGKIAPKEQNHEKATFCTKLTRESGYFDLPAGRQVFPDDFLKELNRKVKAYYPWPGVWTRWNKKIVKFLPKGLIQMEGKKALSVKDFLNGYPNFPLKNLINPEN